MEKARDNISLLLTLLDEYSFFLEGELKVFSQYKKDISPLLERAIIYYIGECALLKKEISGLKREIFLFKEKHIVQNDNFFQPLHR